MRACVPEDHPDVSSSVVVLAPDGEKQGPGLAVIGYVVPVLLRIKRCIACTELHTPLTYSIAYSIHVRSNCGFYLHVHVL